MHLSCTVVISKLQPEVSPLCILGPSLNWTARCTFCATGKWYQYNYFLQNKLVKVDKKEQQEQEIQETLQKFNSFKWRGRGRGKLTGATRWVAPLFCTRIESHEARPGRCLTAEFFLAKRSSGDVVTFWRQQFFSFFTTKTMSWLGGWRQEGGGISKLEKLHRRDANTYIEHLMLPRCW